MTDTAISPLRRRMIEDMTIRQLKPTTQHNYIRFVKELSILFGQSPDKAAFEDIRRYQLDLTSRGVSPGSINRAMAALKFLFPDHGATVRHCQSYSAGAATAEATGDPEPRGGDPSVGGGSGPQVQGGISGGLWAGLRISEIVSLKVSDIDSKRMVIRIEPCGWLSACGWPAPENLRINQK